MREIKEFCVSRLENKWPTNIRKNECKKKIGVEIFCSRFTNMKNSWKTLTRNFPITGRTLWKHDFFCCCFSLFGRSGLLLSLNYFLLFSSGVNGQVNILSLLSPKRIHFFLFDSLPSLMKRIFYCLFLEDFN